MTFLAWMGEHPILTVILAILISMTVGTSIEAIVNRKG